MEFCNYYGIMVLSKYEIMELSNLYEIMEFWNDGIRELFNNIIQAIMELLWYYGIVELWNYYGIVELWNYYGIVEL